MKNLQELFEHQLKDLHSAEDQLIKALPKLAKKAKDDALRKALEKHLEETKEHKSRLEKIGKDIGIDVKGETCKGMKGLIEETESMMKELKNDEVKNAGIIADAQRVEHYEISGYGTAVRYAKELGYDDIAKTLQTTLDEEYHADKVLNDVAEKRLNREAI